MMRWTNILFDLDGTLTDPVEGITGSVKHAMSQLDYPIPEQAVLEKFIGPPLDEVFPQVCGFDEAQTLKAIDYFREYFRRQGINENRLYLGMPALLATLRDAGCTLHVATTKPTLFASQILESFDLAQYFTCVVGSGLEHAGLPKAEIVARVLEETGADPATAIMVGDRRHDVIGAHKNNIPCVGVLYGYGGREELERAGADYIAADIPGLQTILTAN